MSACAIAFAARKERLGLATLLISIPTMFDVLAPKKPVSTMTKGRKGRLSAMSAMRISTASVAPPK